MESIPTAVPGLPLHSLLQLFPAMAGPKKQVMNFCHPWTRSPPQSQRATFANVLLPPTPT